MCARRRDTRCCDSATGPPARFYVSDAVAVHGRCVREEEGVDIRFAGVVIDHRLAEVVIRVGLVGQTFTLAVDRDESR